MTVFRRRVAPTRLLFTLVVLMSTATGRADEQNALCNHDEPDGWGTLGQSGKDVCSIARELMGTCQLSLIPSLGVDTNTGLENTWYTASRFKDDRTLRAGVRCACDRVMYNLLSACAGCQKWGWPDVINSNFTWQSFHTYQDGACSNSTHTKRAVNWNSQPPTWATTFNQDTFDPIGVQTQISSATLPASTNISPATADSVAETPSATGDVAQFTSSSPGPPIGAIVGGVIGGLIFLGAIAGLACWIYCRKRRARDVAPSAEFLKPEYYATPPLLPAHERRESAYQDEIEEDTEPSPTRRHSWANGLMTTRRHEDDDSEMLPPFTRGAYIGPSPHEKGYPERRDTGETDITMRTNNTTTFLLSSPSPNRRPGASDYFT